MDLPVTVKLNCGAFLPLGAVTESVWPEAETALPEESERVNC